MTTKDFDQYDPAVEITIEQLVEALLDDSEPLLPQYLLRLSDLEGAELGAVRANWLDIPLHRRQSLMEDLQLLAREDTVLSFETIAQLALADRDARVRLGGIQTLMANECDNPDLIPLLLNLAEHDPNDHIRASAVDALGPHVFRGELEQFSKDVKRSLENRLLAIAESDDLELVRRRAVETLGYSGRNEIVHLIRQAISSGDERWIASALTAMGRSADEQWADQVLQYLDHTNDLIRLEAVKAAGELDLLAARKHLINNLQDEQDEIRLASVWSLSQIGGEGIAERLAKQLKRARRQDEIDFIEQALENLAFNSDLEEGFGMFYVPRSSNADESDDSEDSYPWEFENTNASEELEDEFLLFDDMDLDDDEDDQDLWSIEDLIDDEDDIN